MWGKNSIGVHEKLCKGCEQIILENIHVNDDFVTARGRSFKITSIKDDKIHIETCGGGSKWFHLEHAGLCLHWMRVDKKRIEGVGSVNKNSIRGLVGANGILAKCKKCEWNPAYIWAILAKLPRVKREKENYLFYL